MRKTMSLQALYDELLLINPTFGWNELLQLLRWQLDQGNEVGFSFGFYARKIILASRQHQAEARERVASLRGKSDPSSMSSVVSAAMEAHG